MLDKIWIDGDLLQSEDAQRRLSTKLNDLLERLDTRLSSVEKSIAPDESPDNEVIDAGGLDTYAIQQGANGVEIKVRKHSFVYELRWRYTDVPDGWKYMMQASNEFNIPVSREAPITAQIRYMRTPFSKWSQWQEVSLDQISIFPTEPDSNTFSITSVSPWSIKVDWEWPTLPSGRFSFHARMYVAEWLGGSEPVIDDAVLAADISFPENTATATGLRPSTQYRVWVKLVSHPIIGGLAVGGDGWTEIFTFGPLDTTTLNKEWSVKVVGPDVITGPLVVDDFDVDNWTFVGSPNFIKGISAFLYYSAPRSFFVTRGSGAGLTAVLTQDISLSSSGRPSASIAVRSDANRLYQIIVAFYSGSTYRGSINVTNPPIKDQWVVLSSNIGEWTDITKIEIDLIWNSGYYGSVYLDYLNLSGYTPQPVVSASSPILEIPIFPADTLPVNLGLGRITGQGSYYSGSTTTWNVPAGKVWRVRSLITTQSTNTVTMGSTNLNHSFTGAATLTNIDVIIGPGEYVKFVPGTNGGNCRWVYDEYTLPSNALWFVDTIITNLISFPASDKRNSYGWIIRYSLPVNLYRASHSAHSTAPPGDDWRTSKWTNMWTFYGQDYFWLSASGTGYLTGLMYFI